MAQSRNEAPFIRDSIDNSPRPRIQGTNTFYVYKVVGFKPFTKLNKVLKENSLNIIRIEKNLVFELNCDIVQVKTILSLFPSNESLKDRILKYHSALSIAINDTLPVEKNLLLISKEIITEENMEEIEIYTIENAIPNIYNNPSMTYLGLGSFSQFKGVKDIQYKFILVNENPTESKKIKSIELETPYETLISKIGGKVNKNDIEFTCDTIQPVWMIPNNIDDFKLTIYSPWLDSAKVYLPEWLIFSDFVNGFFNEELFGDYVSNTPFWKKGSVLYRVQNRFDTNQQLLNKYYSTLLFMLCFSWIYYSGFPNVLGSQALDNAHQESYIKFRVDSNLQELLKASGTITTANDSYLDRYIKNSYLENDEEKQNKMFAYLNMLGSFVFSDYNYFGGGTNLNKILNPFYFQIDTTKMDDLCYFIPVDADYGSIGQANFIKKTGALIVGDNELKIEKIKTFDTFRFRSLYDDSVYTTTNNFDFIWIMNPLNSSFIYNDYKYFEPKFSNQKGNMDNEIHLKLESVYYENTSTTKKCFFSKVINVDGINPTYKQLIVEKEDKSEWKVGDILNLNIGFNIIRTNPNTDENSETYIYLDKISGIFKDRLILKQTQMIKDISGNFEILIEIKDSIHLYISPKYKINLAIDFVGIGNFNCYIGDESISLKEKFKNISQSVPIQAQGQNWIWGNLSNPIVINQTLNTTPGQFKLTPASFTGLMYFSEKDFSFKDFYSKLNSPFFTRYSWANFKAKKFNKTYSDSLKQNFVLNIKDREIESIDEIYINGIYGGDCKLTINYEDDSKEEIEFTLFDDLNETVSLTTIRF